MIQGQRHGALKVVRVAALLLIGLAVAQAQTASAGNVLFWGDLQQVDAYYPLLDVITIGEGQTAMTTPGAVQGFTVPDKAFSAMGSGSFVSVFPTYPFFSYVATFSNGPGLLGPSALAPNTTITMLASNSQYPYLTASPAPGFVRLKAGPNGFGGPMKMVQRRVTNFTKIPLVGGLSQGVASVSWAGGSALGGQKIIGGGWGQHTSLTTGGGNPVAFAAATVVRPRAIAMTGTVTISNPVGAATTYSVQTGMDSRVASSTAFAGSIQLVAARQLYNYDVTVPVPIGVPPGDGSGTVNSLVFGGTSVMKASLNFLPVPEPATTSLLASGVLALAGLAMKRRRRS